MLAWIRSDGCGRLGPTAFLHQIGCTRRFLIQAVGCICARGLFSFLDKEIEMLNVKCFHCGKSFAMDTDVAAAWLEEHKEERPKHYTAHCRFCRRAIKMPIRQIRPHLPAKQEQG